MSIKLDTIPSQCKIARIKPLFKKSIKTGAKSYKPISLLPLISKAMEKSIHDQTKDFLQRNGLFYSYGFEFNRSSKGFWHLKSQNFIG